jgi:hypothetical protein
MAPLGENRTSATASVHATRSGGVSPPWNTLRMGTLNGQIHRIAVADAVCNPRRAEARGVERERSQLQRRYSHPRRADARRSCGYAFVHRTNPLFFRHTVVVTAPGAGGVSPPWQSSALIGENRTNPASEPGELPVFRATGIILVGEKRPFATASVHAIMSGGRKPPVGKYRCGRREYRVCENDRTWTTSGRGKPPVGKLARRGWEMIRA